MFGNISMPRIAELYEAFEALDINNQEEREEGQEESEISLNEGRQIEPVGAISDEVDEAVLGPNVHDDKENVLATPTQPIVLLPRITLAPMKLGKRHLRVRFDPLDIASDDAVAFVAPAQSHEQRAKVVRRISFRSV